MKNRFYSRIVLIMTLLLISSATQAGVDSVTRTYDTTLIKIEEEQCEGGVLVVYARDIKLGENLMISDNAKVHFNIRK